MSATGVTTTEPKAEGSPIMGGSGITEGLSPAQAGGRRRRRKTKGKRKSKAKRTRRRRRGRGRR
jgi:hypothetical protein